MCVVVEFGRPGTNVKEKQVEKYKKYLQKTGLFKKVEAGLGYVICDSAIKNDIEFRMCLEAIPDEYIDVVKTYLEEEHFENLLNGAYVALGKKSLSSGKDLYEILAVDCHKVQSLGEFAYAQGLAIEAIGRAMLKNCASGCGTVMELLEEPYNISSIRPDLAILFDSEDDLSKFYENMLKEPWKFRVQMKP